MKKCAVLWIMAFCCGLPLAAQEVNSEKTGEETKTEKTFKNTIRLNITNPLIFGSSSLVLGYERVLNKQFSFSVNVGRTTLPNFKSFNFSGDSSFQINKVKKDRGFLMTGDFRYYPASENKFSAPRGLYFGPYASFVTLGRENTWTLQTNSFTGDVKTDFNFQFFSVGAQLGYQFIIWKRVALDFVLVGPGVAFYQFSAKVNTDLSQEDESALFDRINEILQEKFPGYNYVIDGEFKTSGTAKTTSIGYRYVVHLGFRF
jgi:hypothetical protein